MKRSNAMSSTAACSSSQPPIQLTHRTLQTSWLSQLVRLSLEEKTQFAHRSSEREANDKKWNETIVEAAIGVEQAASNLQVKVTSYEKNIDDLLASLKIWFAISN
ncbi:hypothetical protein GUJ93_ZPchr0001g30117 [Zizania palustris]|uniref:Uncharacterized protein n=1 Tax=Zizania palustris TaxID=103762 RepID=A0A8J5RSG0_ZIZPA|nr:hypothetical protein GUJ93_ZPchr0001g30117 [Zizania palustris]